jgi:hypothetical protein
MTQLPIFCTLKSGEVPMKLVQAAFVSLFLLAAPQMSFANTSSSSTSSTKECCCVNQSMKKTKTHASRSHHVHQQAGTVKQTQATRPYYKPPTQTAAVDNLKSNFFVEGPGPQSNPVRGRRTRFDQSGRKGRCGRERESDEVMRRVSAAKKRIPAGPLSRASG